MKKISALVLGSFVLPMLAFAQSAGTAVTGQFDIPGGVEGAPQGIRSFEGFIGIFERLTNWLFIVLMILAVLFIILAAFDYLTAGGDEEKVGKAHQKIIYAVVAIAVAFLAKGVSFVVQQLLFK